MVWDEMPSPSAQAGVAPEPEAPNARLAGRVVLAGSSLPSVVKATVPLAISPSGVLTSVAGTAAISAVQLLAPV